MKRKQLNIVIDGDLEREDFDEEEKEIAIKILKELEGLLVFRATLILELCLKAIQYSKVQG